MDAILPSLSVAIACYNEEATIRQVIDESAEAANRIAREFRILVVDDGSRDRSREIIQALVPDRPWLEARFHEHNQGFGGTFKELYTYDVCAFNAIMSGDAQFPPAELVKMAAALERADLVIGRRSTRADSPARRRNSLVYNSLVSILAGHAVHDVNSISLARVDLVRGLRLQAASAFLHAEFYLEFHRRGGRIAEVDIEHLPRRHGTALGARPAVIQSTARELLAYAFSRGPAWKRRGRPDTLPNP